MSSRTRFGPNPKALVTRIILPLLLGATAVIPVVALSGAAQQPASQGAEPVAPGILHDPANRPDVYDNLPPDKRAALDEENELRKQALSHPLSQRTPDAANVAGYVPIPQHIGPPHRDAGAGTIIEADCNFAFKNEDFSSWNKWFEVVGNTSIVVCAGNKHSDYTQGLINVEIRTADRTRGLIGPSWHPTPNKSGRVTIVDAVGEVLVLRAVDGTTLYFDVGTRAYVPPPSPARTATLFLRGTGTTANPAVQFLSETAPSGSTAKYNDSTNVNFSGGNAWKPVGDWTQTPDPALGRLVSLSGLHVWLGLKNSDDQGTSFDLKAEVFRNGDLVASGLTRCVQGITRNPSVAKEVTVAFGGFSPAAFNGTDDLVLKVSTRIGTNPDDSKCAGHSNAVGIRLYFDSLDQPSSFGSTFQTP